MNMDYVNALMASGLELRTLGDNFASGELIEQNDVMTTRYYVDVYEDGVIDGGRERTLKAKARHVKARNKPDMNVQGVSVDHVKITSQVNSVEQLTDVLRAIRQMRQDGTSSAGLYYEPNRRERDANGVSVSAG